MKRQILQTAINLVFIERESLSFLNQIIKRKGIAYAILKKAPVNGLASDNAYNIGARKLLHLQTSQFPLVSELADSMLSTLESPYMKWSNN